MAANKRQAQLFSRIFDGAPVETGGENRDGSLIMDPQLDERTLRLDAVTAVSEFLEALFAREDGGA